MQPLCTVRFDMCLCWSLYVAEMCVLGTRLVVMVFRLLVACWWNTFMETSSMLWVSPSTTFANSWIVFTTAGLPLQLKKVPLFM